jgi:hypothetical protein
MILSQPSEPLAVCAYAMKTNDRGRAFGSPVVLVKSHLSASALVGLERRGSFLACSDLHLTADPNF